MSDRNVADGVRMRHRTMALGADTSVAWCH